MIHLFLRRGYELAILGCMLGFNAIALAAGPDYRVVTFGDSTTANHGNVRNYTTQLRDMFPGIEIINKGVGSNTTALAAERFQVDVLDQNPDLVVIQFGINDAAVDVWKNPPVTSSRVSLADYEKNLRHFVSEIRKGGGEVILMTPNQVRWTPGLLRKYGKPPYDPSVPQGASVVLSGYAEVVRKIARELKVPLVDVYAFYDTPERRDSACPELLTDGLHPSEKGHAEVAKALAEMIKPKISSRSGKH